ncbi:sulfatase [Paenibacillus sp. YYML68]|uniref:sulfatase family protein n=1 Tax=Paenibacillus sp. YYML68 TaxID=2909250 RepID=UPI00248F781D|nr:sulfatase [Paenibacillus sp. YYML68]
MTTQGKRIGSKPNIVLVYMDDMGYGDIGCYGNTIIRTPVMDGIASSGVRFTQMYAAAPTCSPSRCGLLTGRYPQKAGIPRVLWPEDTCGISSEDKTIAGYLKDSGYVSKCIGKWHLGSQPEHYPTRHGFDEFYGLLYSNDMLPLYMYRNEEVEEEEVDQSTVTEKYTREAIQFIEANKDQPFFCYLAHTMPHIPLHVPEAFRGKSAGGTYGDTLECIDFYLGEILNALRANGLEENTIFIVSSDNGPWYEGSCAGLRGRKFEVYEGGVRMPFVAQWKSVIPEGTVCEEVASLMDLLPTFVELAGGTVDEERVDGKPILPLLLGEGTSPHEALYFYVNDSLNAVRSGKWKLHVASGIGKDRSIKEMPQLFDMDIDPGECYNLADRNPEVVQSLIAMMKAFDQCVQPVANTTRINRNADGRFEV